jgi:hypothetical protein
MTSPNQDYAQANQRGLEHGFHLYRSHRRGPPRKRARRDIEFFGGAITDRFGRLHELARLLVSGISRRESAGLTGACRKTANTLARLIEQHQQVCLCCLCGKPSGHIGMCSHRFKRFPVRQATMRRLWDKYRRSA